MLFINVDFTNISYLKHQYCSKVQLRFMYLMLFPQEDDSKTHLKCLSSPHFSLLSELFNIFLYKMSHIAKLSG